MSTFKKFRAGLAIESLQTFAITGNSAISCIPFKTLDGINKTSVTVSNQSPAYVGPSANVFSCYGGLIPVVTADEMLNYSFDDYQISEIGATTYSHIRTVGNYSSTRTFVITVTNSGEEDITVKCVKFKKGTYANTTGYAGDMALVCAVYLSESEYVTVPAGEDRTITLVMEIGEHAS